MQRQRATKLEMNKRLLSIQGWIIEGVPSTIIVQQILHKEWCTSDRHAERLLAEAREQWIKYENTNLSELRKLKVQQLQNMKRSLKPEFAGTPAGIRALLAIDKEIIKIQGLAAPKGFNPEDDEDPAIAFKAKVDNPIKVNIIAKRPVTE